MMSFFIKVSILTDKLKKCSVRGIGSRITLEGCIASRITLEGCIASVTARDEGTAMVWPEGKIFKNIAFTWPENA